MKHYLALDAQIVHSCDFESGIIKVLDGKLDELSKNQKKALQVFTMESINLSDEETDGMNLAQKALKNKRRKLFIMNDRRYMNLEFIPPTSNIVERLFSSARLVLTDYRKSMSPYTFECVMFLKFNTSLWDINTVSKIVGKEN
jgi:hypothetical protein